MKISFCTWIKDRLWQFRDTIFLNMERAAKYDAEFAVIDVSSTDGLREFVYENLRNEFRFKFRTIQLPELHFAKLYNICHREGAGDILVSLDADNVIGPQYCKTLLKVMEKHKGKCIFHAWTGDWLDGTCGRLALTRETFNRVGGYDENLGPVGSQDIDIRDRVKALGYPCVLDKHPEVVGYAIRNTQLDSIRHIGKGSLEEYNHHNSANAVKSRLNIKAGRIKANE
jgi:hypothetical protein